jgi:LysR family cyn operon transcriptional activator
VTPHIPVEMESVEALIDVCRHSRLASIVPERAAQLAPDMHALDLTGPMLKRQAGILWRRGGAPSMAAQAFAHMLAARLGER